MRPFIFLFFPVLLLSGLSAGFAQIEWEILAHPTTRDLKELSFIDAENGWAAGDSGTIVMTSDGGVSWIQQNSTTEFDIVDIEMVEGGFGWALSQQYPIDTNQTYGTELLRTSDGGQTWSFVTRFDEFYNSVAFVSPTRGVMGGNLGKLFYTENGGDTWTTAVIDSPDYARWPIWHIQFRDSLYGMALGGLFDVTGLVWTTTDGGKYWDHRRVAGEPIFGVHYFDSVEILVVGGDIDFGSGMVRTLNGGESWEYTYLGIWGQAVSLSFRTPYEGWAPLGFAATYMVSVDSGRTWDDQYTPDSTAMFDVVFIDSTIGYMVGAHGTVLKYTGPTVSVAPEPASIPERPLLYQNYPNPFNPSTKIRYHVAQRSRVDVRITDMAGREVGSIREGTLEPGQYERIFDGGNLASGVYILRVSQYPLNRGTPAHSSIKMVLLR
jgi:photosystem II stability/assembly factor-like uncharacterized protein